MFWFYVLFLRVPLQDKISNLQNTAASFHSYFDFLAGFPNTSPYFTGAILIMISLRWLFALKVTRAFGPFTKMVKLLAASLAVWLLFTAALLLLSANYLTLLLSEEGDLSADLYSSFKVLFAGMVGKVSFVSFNGVWAAHLSYMAFVLVLSAVLVGMVIAKINSIYTSVVRQGTLHYYKDLFDLRYLFRLHPRYGFLAALDHPFSLVLLPLFLPLLCCLPRKHLPRANNCLLRAFYAPQLLFFSLALFAVGLLLTLPAYLSTLFIRLRLFFILPSSSFKALLSLLLFLPFGPIRLVLANFQDTL